MTLTLRLIILCFLYYYTFKRFYQMPKITIVLIAFIAALIWVFAFGGYTNKKEQQAEHTQNSSVD